MKIYAVTVLPGGRITIPADIRKELGIQPGDSLTWSVREGSLYLAKQSPDESGRPPPQKSASPSEKREEK